MRKNRRLIWISMVAVLVAVALYDRTSAFAQPGDASDPLVSRSYVDGQINQLKALIAALSGGTAQSPTVPAPSGGTISTAEKDAIIAEALAYFEALYGDTMRQISEQGLGQGVPQGSTQGSNQGSSQDPSQGAAPGSSLGATQPVADTQGYTVVRGYAGQTLIGVSGAEMILRGGTAVAVSGVNGLCDITEGVDVVNGASIKLNHLLIVPASDGRGVRFTTDAYLMIKGGYYIVE